MIVGVTVGPEPRFDPSSHVCAKAHTPLAGSENVNYWIAGAGSRGP